MKTRWIAIALIVLLAGGALYYSERKKLSAPVGPETVTGWLAETQRQVSRVPMKVTRLSDAEERAIGDAMIQRELRYPQSAFPPSAQDQQFEAYLQGVGKALGARAHRKLDYRFYYVADPRFRNAYALPGGHIVFGKGLAMALETEDQLAAVLGHEIEHVDRYHCAERVQVEAHLRKVPLGGLANLPIAIFQAGYTKEQELEADREGTALAVKSGYSPHGAIRMFELFERFRRQEERRASTPTSEVMKGALHGVADYFRSHPHPRERKERIADLINRQRWPVIAERPLQVKP